MSHRSWRKPLLSENEKSSQAEALRIWGTIPTPLYNELRTAISGKSLSDAQNIFHQHVAKLKSTYPKCKVDVDPRGPYKSRSGNTFQRFEASQGENFYLQFERAEKACQANQMYDRKLRVKQGVGRMARYVNTEPEIQTWQDLESLLRRKKEEARMLEQNRLNTLAREAEKRAKEEARRFASVKQGNLLGLSAPVEPNLLSFGPTKEGLASRGNELKNIFKGGRKTRRARKQKTRKARK
jgi:hypothetical protein